MNSLDTGHASPLSVQNTPNVVTNGVDALAPVNGDIKHDPAASPPAPSPSTPVSTVNNASVKIDIDYDEQESDARNEPMPIKNVETIENSVVHTASGMSVISACTSDLEMFTNRLKEQDVNMDEPHNEMPMNGINGDADHKENVVQDNDTQMATPTQTPLNGDSSMYSINGAATSSPAASTPADDRDRDHDVEDQPPPAKRARMHSDADHASFTHNTPPPASASPPPISAVTSHPGTPAPPFSSAGSSITGTQYKFAQSTVRSLKKMKDAVPFLKPVDYVALNVPHYPQVIKHPMDFSTVERKLTASNPGKPDPNTSNPRYHTIDEFVHDVRLIFQNCITFNGPDHVITVMGKRVEEVFDKQLKHMPPAEQAKPPPPPKKATPPPPPPVSAPPPKKAAAVARRPSTSVPVIRRSDEAAGRPKREIHPPPPKDLPYADAPKKVRKGKGVRDDGTADQLKFCGKLLNDLHKKQWYHIANPFYEPVDWLALDLPTYPKLIKKPMDLATMRKKLEGGQYPTAQKFFDDFKLMIRNCFVFNPAGTPVNQAGIELQRLFDEKWKQLPPLREVMSEDEEDEEDEDSEDERQRAIADLESRIEEMKNNVAALKNSKKEKKKKEKKEKPPVASTSKPAAKPPKAVSKKKSSKKAITENDALTFEQKKDLSDSISKLDEAKLEKVIQIIHEGVPEIRDSTEEIELEIDSLPPAVLTKLYNFVIRPMRQPPVKRNRTGKGTGTGGLKRKSMDEDVEAEKIRLLEERMALFNQQENGGGSMPTRQVDSDHSSDSSDSSDGSGSDSD